MTAVSHTTAPNQRSAAWCGGKFGPRNPKSQLVVGPSEYRTRIEAANPITPVRVATIAATRGRKPGLRSHHRGTKLSRPGTTTEGRNTPVGQSEPPLNQPNETWHDRSYALPLAIRNVAGPSTTGMTTNHKSGAPQLQSDFHPCRGRTPARSSAINAKGSNTSPMAASTQPTHG